MSTILVTGGAGYIGSHILPTIRRLGYRPLVLDNLVEGHQTAVGDAELVIGGLEDFGSLRAIMWANRPLAVFHFAAACSVPESVLDPLKYYEANLIGTHNLMRAIIETGVPRLIFSSTAAVYGEPQATPITEEHPTMPINPYGRTKLAAERMIRDYAEACAFRFVTFRYFNAAGADPQAGLGEDHRPESHLIPLALRTVFEPDEPLQIHGDDYPTLDGTCIRDFVHVKDIVDAHMKGLEYLMDGGENDTFNLGTETGHTVMEVISKVAEVVGQDIPHEIGPRRPGDPARLVASSEKARKILGWKPQHDLLSIIESAWDWHRAHPNGYPERHREPPPSPLLY